MMQMTMDLPALQDEALDGPESGSAVVVANTKPRKVVRRGRGAGSSATQRAPESKTEIVLKKLRLARGATIPTLMEATSWQAHSVRGFLSGTVKKKLGLAVVSEVGKDGQRRYRIVAGGESS